MGYDGIKKVLGFFMSMPSMPSMPMGVVSMSIPMASTTIAEGELGREHHQPSNFRIVCPGLDDPGGNF